MRTRTQLKETFNKIPKPESAIQNQYILLEVLCDIRDLLYGKPDNGFVAPFDDAPLREVFKNSEKHEQEKLDFIKNKKDEPI